MTRQRKRSAGKDDEFRKAREGIMHEHMIECVAAIASGFDIKEANRRHDNIAKLHNQYGTVISKMMKPK